MLAHKGVNNQVTYIVLLWMFCMTTWCKLNYSYVVALLLKLKSNFWILLPPTGSCILLYGFWVPVLWKCKLLKPWRRLVFWKHRAHHHPDSTRNLWQPQLCLAHFCYLFQPNSNAWIGRQQEQWLIELCLCCWRKCRFAALLLWCDFSPLFRGNSCVRI